MIDTNILFDPIYNGGVEVKIFLLYVLEATKNTTCLFCRSTFKTLKSILKVNERKPSVKMKIHPENII